MQLASTASGTVRLLQLGYMLGAAKLAWECWRARASMEKLELQRKRFTNDGETEYDEVDVYTGLTVEDASSADGAEA